MERVTDEHFTNVYNTYKDDVFRLAFSYLRTKEEAEDILQDVFFIYYRKPPKNEENLKGWLLTTTVNCAKNQLRKRSKMKRASETEMEGIISEDNPDRKYAYLLDALDELDEKYQKPLRLYYYANMSVEEIARALFLSPAAVKKRLERGRDKLKEKLLVLEVVHEY